MRFRGESLRLFGDLTDLVVTDIKVGSNSQLPTADPIEARTFEANHPMSLDHCPISMTVRVFLFNRSYIRPSASVGGAMSGTAWIVPAVQASAGWKEEDKPCRS
jgi:hypothetical protein